MYLASLIIRNRRMEEGHALRQIVFRLASGKIYKFNVKSSVSMKNLRKIIIAAAALPSKHLQMVNSGKDYAEYEHFSLGQLFPKDNEVEFLVNPLPESELPLPIKLKQGANCVNHKFKFPYFYCYNCRLSICSLCVQSSEHLGHQLIDKHDYVQNTDVILDSLFSDFKELLSEQTLQKENEIQQYKNKIEQEIFPNIINHLNTLRSKVLQSMNFYIESVNRNKHQLLENVDTLKNQSYDGIEQLKKQLKIDEIMVDEEIFLAFDEKLKRIGNEKERILCESGKYEEVVSLVGVVSANIDKIYEDLLHTIETKINQSVIEPIQERLTENTLSPITKEEVHNILFSDLKKQRRPNFDPQPSKKKDFLSGLFSNRNNGVSGNLTNLYSSSKKENFRSGSKYSAMSSASKDLNRLTYSEDCIFTVKPGTRSIVGYNERTEEIFENEFSQKEILGLDNFLAWSSLANYQGRLYITGGIKDEEPTNFAHIYIAKNNKLLALPPLPSNRANHSSVIQNGYLFVAGGTNNRSVDYFDLNHYRWSTIGELTQERNHPTLYIHEKYLYVFFGQGANGEYLDTFERVDISGKEETQLIRYIKDPSWDLRLSGSATIEIDADTVLFVGGRTPTGYNRDNIYKYTFSEMRFDHFNRDLEGDTFFAECRLIRCKDGNFTNFNRVDNNLIKIILDDDGNSDSN